METESNKEFSSNSKSSFVEISKREHEVLECIIRGLSQKEIANELNIEPKTVDNHICSIKRKIGVTKNTEMFGYYIATIRGKKFDLKLLHKFGISIFFVLLHICTLSE